MLIMAQLPINDLPTLQAATAVVADLFVNTAWVHPHKTCVSDRGPKVQKQSTESLDPFNHFYFLLINTLIRDHPSRLGLTNPWSGTSQGWKENPVKQATISAAAEAAPKMRAFVEHHFAEPISSSIRQKRALRERVCQPCGRSVGGAATLHSTILHFGLMQLLCMGTLKTVSQVWREKHKK